VYAGSADSTVYAIRSDGTLAWKTPMLGWPTYLTPVADNRLYVATSGSHGTSDRVGEAYALDAGTGAVVWHAHVSIQANAITVADGTAYVSSFDNTVYAFRVGTSSPLWTVKVRDFVTGAAVVADGVVYFASMDKNVYAVNAATGAVVWKRDTGHGLYV